MGAVLAACGKRKDESVGPLNEPPLPPRRHEEKGEKSARTVTGSHDIQFPSERVGSETARPFYNVSPARTPVHQAISPTRTPPVTSRPNTIDEMESGVRSSSSARGREEEPRGFFYNAFSTMRNSVVSFFTPHKETKKESGGAEADQNVTGNLVFLDEHSAGGTANFTETQQTRASISTRTASSAPTPTPSKSQIVWEEVTSIPAQGSSVQSKSSSTLTTTPAKGDSSAPLKSGTELPNPTVGGSSIKRNKRPQLSFAETPEVIQRTDLETSVAPGASASMLSAGLSMSSSDRKRPPNLTPTLQLRPAEDTSSYRVTQSGTFSKAGFRIGKSGISSTSQSNSELDSELSKMSVSDLKLGKFLGRGSASSVRHAVHIRTGKDIALKEIEIHDATRRQQLIPELQALMTTRHPNLVNLYSCFFESGTMYVALEYMNGGSVDALSRKHGPLPDAALVGILFQTLQGLCFLHDRNKLHRDMKSENLLLNSSGWVKIADFGLSRDVSLNGSAKTWVGTATYMSPERLQGYEYNFSSDVWSVGIVAIELFLGHHPLKEFAASELDLLTAVLDGPEIPKGLSPNLEDFVRQCLRPDPKDRPFVEDLLDHPFFEACPDDDAARALVAALLSGETSPRSAFSAGMNGRLSTTLDKAFG